MTETDLRPTSVEEMDHKVRKRSSSRSSRLSWGPLRMLKESEVPLRRTYFARFFSLYVFMCEEGQERVRGLIKDVTRGCELSE